MITIAEFRELQRPPLVIYEPKILQLAIYLIIVDPTENHIRLLGLKRRFPLITKTKANYSLANFLIISEC